MVSLYKKNVWNDPKTINIIAQGVFNDYYKVKLIACYFLIETTEVKDIESSDYEDEEAINTKEKKGSKKTKSKEVRLDREKKRAVKR